MIVTDFDTVAAFVSEHLEIDIPERHRGACIGWMKKWDVVSGVVYERYTGTSVVASIVNLPGNIMSRKFLWTIFDYPFNQLKVKKMLIFVEATNTKSMKMVEKMGFVKTCTIDDVFPSGAMVIYTIEKDQCRYLKERYHGKIKQNA